MFHAHNQFLQLLVVGGLVLTTAVVVMIAAAITVAARSRRLDGLFGPVFLLALAGTCVLEPSMVIVDNFFLFPVYVLPLGTLMLGDLSPPPAESVRGDTSPDLAASRLPARKFDQCMTSVGEAPEGLH